MAYLSVPTVAARDSFLVAVQDLRDEGWLADFPVDQVAADFSAYVARTASVGTFWDVPTGELWYVQGNDYLGTVVVRHRLTAQLLRADAQEQARCRRHAAHGARARADGAVARRPGRRTRVARVDLH
ncbi:MAG: hypothetical protein ACQSGP_26835 [Frankia sp.]